MKKARNIVMLLLVPLFSAAAVCGLIFTFGFETVRKIDSLAFLYVGRSSTYQVLITVGLLWASFYLLVLVVFPREKYREALTHLSKDRLGTGCIGVVGPISAYAFGLDMIGGDIYLGELISAFIHFLGIMGVGLSMLMIIPALLVETVLCASDIVGIGMVKYWKSLLISIVFLLVLPLMIVFGMELAMATPVSVVNCAACECETVKKSGDLNKGEGKQGKIHKPDAVEKRPMTQPE